MISVIVPVYNVETYLKECLDSLLAQTCEDLEVIMVDDGSKDASGRVCEEYAACYDHFHVIHKENQGLGMARNTGLQYVTGDYVTFLDSDDYLAPDCLERLYETLKAEQADYCKCGFKRVNNEKQVLYTVHYQDEVFSGRDAGRVLLPRLIGSAPHKKDGIEPSVWGTLFAVKHIKDHNIQFPSERELISEDIAFHIEYMQYARGGCTSSYAGYHYRVNEKSLTQSYRKDRFEACRFFYQEMKKRLEALEYDEMTLQRLSRKFFIYLRACIAQETKKVSSLSRKENLANIKRICCDDLVRQVIDHYPVGNLGLKQKAFLYMIKYKMTYILYSMAVFRFL